MGLYPYILNCYKIKEEYKNKYGVNNASEKNKTE